MMKPKCYARVRWPANVFSMTRRHPIGSVRLGGYEKDWAGLPVSLALPS